MAVDKIILKDIDLSCHIGLTEEERKYAQSIIIDVVLYTDLSLATDVDDINLTIDYSTVFKIVRECTIEEYKTIERLAGRISSAVKQNFRIEKIRVTVKKPYSLRTKGVKYAAVSILR